MADRSSNVLTHLADRRSAVRALGAASTAFLAALGLGGATGEARGEDKGKTDRNQRAKRTRHMEDANQSADRSTKPAEPVDGGAAAARVKNDSVRAQRKRRRFASKKVNGEPTDPLAANSPGAFSRAFCPGGKGTLLGGGYNVNGTPEQLENLIVVEAGPDDGTSTFTAALRRTSGSGSAGATIQAFAICKG